MRNDKFIIIFLNDDLSDNEKVIAFRTVFGFISSANRTAFGVLLVIFAVVFILGLNYRFMNK